MPLRELKDISLLLATKIRAYMPMFGSPLYPVDIAGTAGVIQYKGSQQAFRDPAVDGVLGSICPTAVTNVIGVAKAGIEVYRSTGDLGKPFLMICQGGGGGARQSGLSATRGFPPTLPRSRPSRRWSPSGRRRGSRAGFPGRLRKVSCPIALPIFGRLNG